MQDHSQEVIDSVDTVILSYASHFSQKETIGIYEDGEVAEYTGKEKSRSITSPFGKEIKQYKYKDSVTTTLYSDRVVIGEREAFSLENVVNASIGPKSAAFSKTDSSSSLRPEYIRIVVETQERDADSNQFHYYYLFTDSGYESKKVENIPESSKEDLHNFCESISQVKESEQHCLLIDHLTVTSGGKVTFKQRGELKIEEWSEAGDRSVEGTIQGETESTGTSQSVSVGSVSTGTSKSQGKINASVNGSIEGDGFESDIELLHITKEKIILEADPKLEIHHNNIEKMIEKEKGLTIISDGLTYNITLPICVTNKDIQTIDYSLIRENITKEKDDKDSPKQALKELESVYEDGLISEQEYNEKRQEILSRL